MQWRRQNTYSTQSAPRQPNSVGRHCQPIGHQAIVQPLNHSNQALENRYNRQLTLKPRMPVQQKFLYLKIGVANKKIDNIVNVTFLNFSFCTIKLTSQSCVKHIHTQVKSYLLSVAQLPCRARFISTELTQQSFTLISIILFLESSYLKPRFHFSALINFLIYLLAKKLAIYGTHTK